MPSLMCRSALPLCPPTSLYVMAHNTASISTYASDWLPPLSSMSAAQTSMCKHAKAEARQRRPVEMQSYICKRLATYQYDQLHCYKCEAGHTFCARSCTLTMLLSQPQTFVGSLHSCCAIYLITADTRWGSGNMCSVAIACG